MYVSVIIYYLIICNQLFLKIILLSSTGRYFALFGLELYYETYRKSVNFI